MAKHIGNLLLVLGVVIGALAAAGAKKAYRTIVLGDETAWPGEFVFRDVASPASRNVLLAREGQELSADVVALLREEGIASVRVRRPALESERFSLSDVQAVAGRVLHTPVVRAGEVDPLSPGRVVTADLVERARAAGLESLPVRAQDGSEASLSLLPAGAEIALAGERLHRAIDLPARIEGGTYLDDERIAELWAAGVDAIDVKTRVRFSLADWSDKWRFLVAVLLTIAGVAVKRRAPGVEAGEGGTPAAGGVDLAGALAELERGLAEIKARLAEIEAGELQRALDPLLAGPAYAFLEGREALRARGGIALYAAVMAPFSSAERKLHRAWSAAVDGAVEEARDCVAAALPFLRDARAALAAAG